MIRHGDCLAILPTLDADSIDACVTDPPYGLEFMGREWDAPWQLGGKSALFGNRERPTPGGWGGTRNANCRTCGGRMRGAKVCRCETPAWDEAPGATRLRQMRGFQDWCELWATELHRVMKPGAHLVAFGGTRTYHRLACAIEDAGFEIRDAIMWHYGSGFPKSLDISKAIDKAAGAEREVLGPSPLAAKQTAKNDTAAYGDFAGSPMLTAPATDAARQWSGWGTALKPATEIICLARKPLSEPTVAANVLRWGTGALNIEQCRIIPSSQPLDADVCAQLFAAGCSPGKRGVFPSQLPHFVQRIVSALVACSNGHTDREHNAAGQDGHTTEEDVRAVRTLLSRLQSSVAICDQSWSESLSSQLCCQTCRRFCDEHSRSVRDAARDGLPSLAGALVDTVRWLYARTYNHGCPCSGPPSSSGASDLRASFLISLIAMAKQEDSTYLASRIESTRRQNRAEMGYHGGNLAAEYATGSSAGRWPANVVHDGSPEVMQAFAAFGEKNCPRASGNPNNPRNGDLHAATSYDLGNGEESHCYRDTGTAARFFKSAGYTEDDLRFHYCGKADKADRCGSLHPTIKPLSLCRWLVRLITPPGGTVLDCFAGSGAIVQAALLEGFSAIGVEREAEYVADIHRRLAHMHGPLFAEAAA